MGSCKYNTLHPDNQVFMRKNIIFLPFMWNKREEVLFSFFSLMLPVFPENFSPSLYTYIFAA